MVKIVSITFINCQSLENVTIEPSEGLTVLVANNNTGKSVLGKMLKICAHPKAYTRKEAKSLIRKRCSFAEIQFKFSDGSVGATKVFADRVMYYFSKTGAKSEMVGTYEPDSRYLNNLSLLVNAEGDFIANLIDLDQSMILIRSNTKANADFVKLVTHHETMNRTMITLQEKAKEFGVKAKNVERIMYQLEGMSKNYEFTNVKQLSDSIEVCEVIIRVSDILADIYSPVENLGYSLVVESDYDQKIRILDFYIELEKVSNENELVKPTTFDTTLGSLLDVYDCLLELKVNSEGVVHYTQSDFDVADLLVEISELADGVVFSTFNHSMFDWLEVYDEIDRVLHTTKMLHNNLVDLRKLDVEIADMNTQLNEFGRRVPCVIYGEVSHINGECIPIDNRQTQERN